MDLEYLLSWTAIGVSILILWYLLLDGLGVFETHEYDPE